MGWLQKWTGKEDAEKAANRRLQAAEIKLNDPNYYDTFNRQMGYFGGLASADQKRLAGQYATATGDIGRGYDSTVASMRDTFGQARDTISSTYGQQRSDITRMQGLNARALASMAGAGYAQMGASAGGSMQAKLAALSGMQQQLGQQSLQNQAQGLQAGLEASGQYMGMTGQLASQEAGQMGQLGSQRANVLAQLASQFAGLQSQAGQNYAQMGLQSGEAAFGNLMQQAILRRQVAQEPLLAQAENYMARANRRAAGFGSLMTLGGAAVGAMFGAPGIGASIGAGLGGAATGQAPSGNWMQGFMGGGGGGFMGGGGAGGGGSMDWMTAAAVPGAGTSALGGQAIGIGMPVW